MREEYLNTVHVNLSNNYKYALISSVSINVLGGDVDGLFVSGHNVHMYIYTGTKRTK